MTAWAGEHIVDLKSRGFENAGLYDPPGVGGTHVMYVLHHADRPSIYAGLPDQPRISLCLPETRSDNTDYEVRRGSAA